MITTETINDMNRRVLKDGQPIGYLLYYPALGGWLFTAASRELSRVYLDTTTAVKNWRDALPVTAR